jgi:methionyl-tRNA synthetase
MSTSLSTVIRPLDLQQRYGNDAFRYFLLRDMTFGLDASFHEVALAERINADLANDLGNLLNRTLGMLGKYRGGVVPAFGAWTAEDEALRDAFLALPSLVRARVDALQFDRALAAVMEAVRSANKYVSDTRPWELAKDEAQAGRLDTVLRNCLEALRCAGILLTPVMPDKMAALRDQLGVSGEVALDDAARWDGVPEGTQARPGEPLFPRIDMEALHARIAAPEADAPPLEHKDPVSMEDFARLELRVAEVTDAKPHPKADRLLVLTLSLGAETRTVVSGIREHYAAADMVGKKVIAVCNMTPVKLRGIESQGMILAAEDAAGRLALAGLDRDLPPGAEVR